MDAIAPDTNIDIDRNWVVLVIRLVYVGDCLDPGTLLKLY